MLKKREEYDHIAIDLGELIMNALRNKDFKRFTGKEKYEPMFKHIQNNLSNIFRRIHAKKSTFFVMDGTEGLWKARRYRRRITKRQDLLTQACAGSPLIVALEDRLQCALLSRQTPRELIFSSTNSPGSAESKIVKWCLDLAARTDTNKNDAICLLGSTQMNLVALGLTPFLNLTCMKFNMGELKVQSLPAILEWLDLSDIVEMGDFATLSRARQDLVWIMLLINGLPISELPEMAGSACRDWLQAYHDECLSQKRFLFIEDRSNGSERLMLDRSAFLCVVDRVCKGTVSKNHLSSSAVSDYFEIALQSHSMILTGCVPNQLYCLSSNDVAVASSVSMVTAQGIQSYLMRMKTPKLSAVVDHRQISPAAYFLTVSNSTTTLGHAIKSYVPAGVDLPAKFIDANLFEDFLKISDASKALQTALQWLHLLHVQQRYFACQPTHMWIRTSGASGPPFGFTYFAIDLGALATENDIRGKALRGEGFSCVQRVKANTPQLVRFSSTKVWEEFDPAKQRDSEKCAARVTSLRIVTYNVQFDRFSKQKTPLGRPGIDWCTETRYIALSKVLSEAAADIICMQECERPWWVYLSKQRWVQDKYYFSCTENSDCISPWGSFLLIHRRLQVKSVAHVNIPGFSGHKSIVPLISIKLNGNMLHLLGVHLMAPFSSHNEENRKNQIQKLIQTVGTKFGGLKVPEDIIVLGDFNDHPKKMLTFPKNLGLLDSWQNSGEESAFTIDGDLNEYCALIIEPDFFGRPDRIYFRSRALLPLRWMLLGTKSVRQELGTSDCPEYLYPSDHFGVLTEFACSA